MGHPIRTLISHSKTLLSTFKSYMKSSTEIKARDNKSCTGNSSRRSGYDLIKMSLISISRRC